MRRLVCRLVLLSFERLNRRDVEAVLSRFADDVHFRFGGDHALAADLRGRDALRAWFGRAFELIPDLRFDVDDVIVTGVPWRVRAITRYRAEGTAGDGRLFAYTGVQFVTIRWGAVTEDLLYPDTQALAAALRDPATEALER
jgi:ketosteroid isomerase-like protein